MAFEGQVEVNARDNVARCAYCHDPFLDDAVVTECPACATRLHPDCVVARRCPTLGCRHQFIEAPLVERLDPAQLPRRVGWPVWTGIVLPLLCFAMNEALADRLAKEEVIPNWQFDTFWSWFGQLRAPEAQRPLYPLVVWSLLALNAAAEQRRGPWIRVGLTGGVVIALVFSVGYLPIILLSLFTSIFLIGLLGLGPYAALAAYSRASKRYAQEAPPPDSKEADAEGLAYVPWTLWSMLALGGGALCVQRMNALWAALPVHDPNCFVATAAARGPRWLVRGRPVRFETGRIIPVTRQLRTLKAGELVLATLLPRAHRALRWVYDRVGPFLAARLGPGSATLAWAMLLPLQVITEVALRALFRSAPRLIARTYEPVAPCPRTEITSW